MSFPYYGKMWIATKNDLENVLLREKVLPKLQPTRDRSYAHRLIGNIYARYIVLCNNLSELYDQTLQVQKRQVIEKVLMSATNRLMELQLEMQKIEMSEFVYADDALLELKLTPQNIEFLRPFYFPRKRDVEVQRVIDEISKIPEEVEETEAPKGLDKYRKVLTPEELEAQRIYREKLDAANLIKIHEKGKQARINWFNVNDFPDKFKPRRRELPTVVYEFMHKPDQIPMYKIKRTNYQTDLYRPKVNIGKFTFYEPPVYRENKLGQLVIVPRKKSEIITQVDEIEEESDEDEDEKAKQIEEENKLETERQAEVEKQKSAAALIIQRCFRRYLKKKALVRENWKRMEICGVVVAPEDKEKPDQKSIEEQMREKRRERKREFDESFRKALEDEKARILKLKTEFIMEDITDDIRQWFREFYDATNDFHRYPEEFEGGTIMVLREETMTPEEFLVEKAKTPAQVAKDKAEKKKKKKEEKKAKKKEAAQKKKEEKAMKILEKKQGPTWNFADEKFESKNFAELDETFATYDNEWKFIDELKNRVEAPIWEWVTIDAYADVQKELRLIVDDFMRIELEILRVALAVDNKERYIPLKHKKPKKEKKKRRESVDVTEGRSLEECYEELKSLNVIRKYPKRSLDEFIGDQNFAAHELRMLNKNPVAHYGDIKNTLRSMVFGMGPLELPKVKSLCIAGPPRCGKKLLVEALCSEMEAVMFDLSPRNVKPIADMDEFITFVMQMAKKLQPSVIFIEGTHKPFIRIITDAERYEEPRKLGGFLLKKIVKKLKNEDSIMLMGTTNQPWNCNFVQLRQCYEKIVAFPPTLDYGTALMTWNKGLRLKKIYNFDASSLARVTRNYTIGDILDLIDRHVDLRRKMKFPFKPLTSEEFVESLLNGPNAKTPLDDKTIKSYNDFGNKIDLYYYERLATMARVQMEIDKEKEAQAKKKEKKAKK